MKHKKESEVVGIVEKSDSHRSSQPERRHW